MRSKAKQKDWAAAVDAIVGRAPRSDSERDPLSAQVRLLALLGTAAPLNVLLDGLATYVETWAEGLCCTVLLADPTGRLLRPGAAPSLPVTYTNAIDPVPIGIGQGSCGTAAARREMVVVEDVEQSDLWTDYRAIALSHGLRACWSMPILDDARALLGTLALYYRERQAPSTHEIDLIQFAASLAAFVIQRHRDAERLRSSEARFEDAVGGTEIGLWGGGIDGSCRWFNDWCARLDIDPCDGPGQLQCWRQRIHPEDIERYAKAVDDSISGAIDYYVVEYRILTRGGRWHWLHERGKVTSRGADGTAQYYVGVCIDIEPRKRLEAALRTAEDRYELAINAARLPVWEYDVPSDTVTGNVHWHQTLGYDVTDKQALHRAETWLSDVHPDDLSRHDRIIAGDGADSTGFYESEFRMKTVTGEYKWLLDRGKVVERTVDGAPLKIVGVSLDVDARKRMEAALRESEERFRDAFEFAAIGMALVAPDGHFLRVNRSLCRIVGYTSGELLATNFQAITHPDDLDEDLGHVRQMLDGSLSHFHMDKRYIHKDGHIVWVLLSASLVRDAGGQPLYFVAQIEDISGRTVAEARLVESELRYRTTADLVPGFVFEGLLNDGYPQPVWVSDGFKRVYGCSLKEFGQLGAERFYDSATRARILAVASTVAEGSDLSMELPLTSLDGEQRWLRVVGRAIPGGSGSAHDRVLGVAEDITERKGLEKALEDATQREQKRLGHEIHDGLGQELTGIAYLAGSLATAAARGRSPPASDLANLSHLATRAIGTCRDIARGVSPLTESRGSLVQSLRQICDLAAAGGNASVDFQAMENAPLTLPWESRDHLHRIAQEALNNVLRHSDADNIEVTIQIESTSVRLEIVDNGKGFSASGAPSMGLGLDSMRQRAAAIGASLLVETRSNGGAAIVCECPQPPSVAEPSNASSPS
jgi:PAS domain S-box-containing protein